MARYALRRTEGTPGLIAALACAVGMSALFAALGIFTPGDIALSARSPRAIIGMGLMLVCTATYILVAWTVGQRRSLELLADLRPLVADPAEMDTASTAIRTAARRTIWLGSAIGIGLSLFNTEPVASLIDNPYPKLAVPISAGQVFLWWLIGLLITTRVSTARAFARLGECVRFDLFRLDAVRPLARNGVVDAAIVVGALLFAPLQSLDAEFRWENYRFALVVAIPSIAFFVVYPMRGLHRRIRADRAARLATVDAQIAELPPGVPNTPEETRALELLLAHRERLIEARTWPLDLRLFSRLFIYLVIPPMAWAGAAFVERFIDAALARG